MTQYSIVDASKLVEGQIEDISVVLANLQAIQAIINGLKNDNIAAAAAIAYSKLALTGSIVNADIAGAAAIAYSKLALTGSVVNGDLSIGYSNYVPTFTGSVSNPNVGSTGVLSGRYVQVGDLVHAMVQITFGGTGIDAGSGAYTLTLPVTARSTFAQQRIGTLTLRDNSISHNEIGAVYQTSDTEINMFAADGTTVSGVNPWTWADSDQLALMLTYEAF